MGQLWKGAARPRTLAAMRAAAMDLGCELAEIEAVFEVEAAGDGFRPDGSLERRFEPHKMPGALTNWRDSYKLKVSEREAAFAAAFAKDPGAALEATSWGAPQIMGFNHAAAGFRTAESMVSAMADGEDAQIAAFARLVLSWGLDSAIRTHDWVAFAREYNGTGQAEVYARRIEKAYRRRSGRASAEVLRLGSTGESVKRLQIALRIHASGTFDHATRAAVEAFQTEQGLAVDGVVGARTWAALEAMGAAPALAQKTSADVGLDRAEDLIRKAGGGTVGGFTLAQVLDRAPEHAVAFLYYGGTALALAYGLTLLVRSVRRARA